MYPNTMPQPPSPSDRDPRQQPPPPHPYQYGNPHGAPYAGVNSAPHAAPRPAPGRDLLAPGLWQVPKAFWVGLVIGAAAFVVHVSAQQISAGSGGYSCSYTDIAGFAAAVAIGGCLVAGWAARARTPVSGRLAVPLMLAFSVALVALGVVHALRGNGTIMSPCDARPLP